MDMYLACHSQEEIAAAVDVAIQTVANKINDFSNFSNVAKNGKTLVIHEEQEFQIPVYNVYTNNVNQLFLL
jgi:predicted transcriptional regulator